MQTAFAKSRERSIGEDRRSTLQWIATQHSASCITFAASFWAWAPLQAGLPSSEVNQQAPI
ncbi:hypothetical protein IPC224_02725 [Pseudomonas aeruginosa]|nr:hypothetical protein JF43_11380 [Pseudomonas aeruginosa]KHE63936.1 hypothetical protein D480_0209000 [Pseudomonas aeruginosa]KRU82892.1 hypothetical protein AN453_28105 [Pseudomonas aeruginosa]KSC59190.1 hypothetical protein AO895_24345 [Pseudomonas aeruginosa]KSC86476.1 hypothetical protein AO894_14765 [Pseudomonas aeruginosa]